MSVEANGRRMIVISFVLLGAALILGAIQLMNAARDDHSPRHITEASVSLTRKLSRLRREVDSLKKSIVERSAVQQMRSGKSWVDSPSIEKPPSFPKPGDDSVSDELTPPPDEQLVATQEERIYDLIASYEDRLANEPVDGEWSTRTARSIREAVQTITSETELLEVACATSMCRVVVNHESEFARRDLARSIASLDPFRAGVFYHYGDDPDALTTTLYVSRSTDEEQ